MCGLNELVECGVNGCLVVEEISGFFGDNVWGSLFVIVLEKNLHGFPLSLGARTSTLVGVLADRGKVAWFDLGNSLRRVIVVGG